MDSSSNQNLEVLKTILAIQHILISKGVCTATEFTQAKDTVGTVMSSVVDLAKSGASEKDLVEQLKKIVNISNGESN